VRGICDFRQVRIKFAGASVKLYLRDFHKH
jgi:hypothetical protein